MKLTEEQLAEGRGFVLAENWEAFEAWMDEHRVVIDRAVVLRALRMCMRMNDPEKAIHMFNVGFENANPSAERAVQRLLNLGCVALVLLVLLGAICGVAAFVKVMVL